MNVTIFKKDYELCIDVWFQEISMPPLWIFWGLTLEDRKSVV